MLASQSSSSNWSIVQTSAFIAHPYNSCHNLENIISNNSRTTDITVPTHEPYEHELPKWSISPGKKTRMVVTWHYCNAQQWWRNCSWPCVCVRKEVLMTEVGLRAWMGEKRKRRYKGVWCVCLCNILEWIGTVISMCRVTISDVRDMIRILVVLQWRYHEAKTRVGGGSDDGGGRTWVGEWHSEGLLVKNGGEEAWPRRGECGAVCDVVVRWWWRGGHRGCCQVAPHTHTAVYEEGHELWDDQCDSSTCINYIYTVQRRDHSTYGYRYTV